MRFIRSLGLHHGFTEQTFSSCVSDKTIINLLLPPFLYSSLNYFHNSIAGFFLFSLWQPIYLSLVELSSKYFYLLANGSTMATDIVFMKNKNDIS